jgi:trimeric autotransporter adhesin
MNRAELGNQFQAEPRIVRSSTIERKQMSTKTTFKRVALVAVAALGLGVLSVAPSSATVINLTATTVNGTATTAVSDSTTAATLRVTFTGTGNTDSVTVTSYVSSKPAGSGAQAASSIRVRLVDTSTSTLETTVKEGSTALAVAGTTVVQGDSTTVIVGGGGTATNSANLGYFFVLPSALTAGTYVITSVITPWSNGVSAGTPVTRDVSIVVSTAAADSKVASVAFSTLSDPTASTSVATVSSTNTARATLSLVLKNAAEQTAARESVTATITGPGTIGVAGGSVGKSVLLAYTTTSLTLSVYSDGTAGVATINVSTPSVTFAPKTITFYASAPKTITAAVYNPVLNVGANSSAVAATAVDTNGVNWAGQLYIKAVAAADALIGGSATDPVACSYNSTVKTHFCPVTTVAVGTANFVVLDETLDTDAVYTAADSAATSNTVALTASAGVPTTVKIAFDKATYQPFEKALITVTPLDAAGKTMGTKTVSSIFATGGISSNIAFGSQSDTLTSVNVTTAAANDTDVTAGAYTYTVYMPAQGDVTISATGGTGLAASGQVKVTATATVVNSSVDAATDAANEATDAANAATDAALAAADAADAATAAAQDASDAVAALSASVSKLISSLRAQITSLTNLVIKIQKKVRA